MTVDILVATFSLKFIYLVVQQDNSVIFSYRTLNTKESKMVYGVTLY